MIDNKNVIYQARLNWIIFFWPAVLFFSMLIIGFQFYQLHTPALIIAIIALIWEGMMWMTYQFTVLMIKKSQVILCTGILVRQTLDIPLNKIESIDIRQSIMGSLFQYGSLVITGTGGSRQYVNFLNSPLTCRRHIEQLMHE